MTGHGIYPGDYLKVTEEGEASYDITTCTHQDLNIMRTQASQATTGRCHTTTTTRMTGEMIAMGYNARKIKSKVYKFDAEIPHLFYRNGGKA